MKMELRKSDKDSIISLINFTVILLTMFYIFERMIANSCETIK